MNTLLLKENTLARGISVVEHQKVENPFKEIKDKDNDNDLRISIAHTCFEITNILAQSAFDLNEVLLLLLIRWNK